MNIKPIISIFALLLIIGVAPYLVLICDDKYSWSEMDINQNGIVSYGEVYEFLDSGKREVTSNGRKCVEYYAYKDGLPFHTVCSE
ncbi:hypothetical protein MAH4_31680 [Sessilibacter sp. MAH4]